MTTFYVNATYYHETGDGELREYPVEAKWLGQALERLEQWADNQPGFIRWGPIHVMTEAGRMEALGQEPLFELQGWEK